MPIKNPQEFNVIAWCYIFICSVFGACVHYVSVKHKLKFKLSILLSQILIALFGGILIIAVATYFSLDMEVAGGLAGLVGWSGAEFIRKITKLIYKKIGVDDDH